MRHMPNIEKAMKIKVTKSGKSYRADAEVLPGTPIVGIGATKAEAKYNLCVNWLYIIARYYTGRRTQGEDSGYAPIIVRLLNEDMEKLGTEIKE